MSAETDLLLVLGATALVWMLTGAFLARAAFMPRAHRHVHCPLLRRDFEVESRELRGELLDVRRCSGLDPPTDFALCGKRCLDTEERIAA